MNCKEILRVLLAAEHPDRPSADVRKHLSRCLSCRTWHRRLVRLERHIPQIPVPATDARERLLAQLREAPAETVPLVRTTAPVAAVRGSGTSRIRYIVATAAGLAAAAVLFAVIGWKVFPPGGTPPPEAKTPKPDALLASLVQHNVRLANATKHPERVQELAKLDEVLHAKTRELALAADTADLAALAELYEKVVKKGVILRATLLSPEERRGVLEPIVKQLAQAEADAEHQAKTMPAGSAGALRTIAKAAHDGHAELGGLLREVKQ